MVKAIRPEVLSPENLHQLLYACRIVDIGLTEEQFRKMVDIQKRLRKNNYAGLSDEEAIICSDLWCRLESYVKEKRLGYEYLIKFLEQERIW